jgi:hypothetical protein
MSNSARSPAGPADAALAGQYPAVALGLVPAAGPIMFDEFLRPGPAGDCRWVDTTLGGSDPTYSNQAPTAVTEAGILRLATAASANSGGVLGHVHSQFSGVPGVGAIWAAKVRLQSGASAAEVWCGFSQSSDRVDSSTSNDFVGVRGVAGANWSGVCKNGTSETAVDLGVACDSTWRALGFRRENDGVQFFVLTLSDVGTWDLDDVGDPVTTNHPNTALRSIALGTYTTNATGKTAEIDFWALGGRTAR